MGRKIIFNVTVYIYLGKRSKGEFNPMCLVNKQYLPVKHNLPHKISFSCSCPPMPAGSYRRF